MDWFENWFGSVYYKILYEHRDDIEAQEFIENLLAYLRPPAGSRMLDIACGEGRHARQLAEHGFDVTGIDIAHSAIEAARAFETTNLQFFVQDMRLPFFINYFNYVFNFFTSFGYFTNHRDHILAAKGFAAALKPDGFLVLDYLNCERAMATLVPDEVLVRGSYEFRIRRRLEQGQIIKEISFNDADGRPRQYSEHVATFYLKDFIEIFKNAGLGMVTTFGDYHLNHFSPIDSPRLIMVFKKRHAQLVY